MAKKYRFALVGLGILGSILYLVFSGIQAEGVPYVRIGELVSSSPSGKSRLVKVTGKVQSGTLEYRPEVPLLKFSVSGPDSDRSIHVVYEGVKPDALRENGHVILQGEYSDSRRRLKAHSLLAKCPSRYKSKYDSYEPASDRSS